MSVLCLYCMQIREWFSAEGEQQLLKAETVEDSLEQVEQTMQNFDSFLAQAAVRKCKPC